jgi:hypothetical protein
VQQATPAVSTAVSPAAAVPRTAGVGVVALAAAATLVARHYRRAR